MSDQKGGTNNKLTHGVHKMTRKDYAIGVNLRIRGEKLDPDAITDILGVSPTISHEKGDTRLTSANHQVTSKTGLWRLEAESCSPLVSDHISKLLSDVSANRDIFNGLKGVDDKHIDVFFATGSDKNGGGTIKVNLSKENIAAIAKTGLPLLITICVTGR